MTNTTKWISDLKESVLGSVRVKHIVLLIVTQNSVGQGWYCQACVCGSYELLVIRITSVLLKPVCWPLNLWAVKQQDLTDSLSLRPHQNKQNPCCWALAYSSSYSLLFVKIRYKIYVF